MVNSPSVLVREDSKTDFFLRIIGTWITSKSNFPVTLRKIAMIDVARVLVAPRFGSSWWIFSLWIKIAGQLVAIFVVVRDGFVCISFGFIPLVIRKSVLAASDSHKI